MDEVGEGHSYYASTFDEEDLNVNVYNTNMHANVNINKEKQVYEWLRTLEVDRDNNEFVAEAASSKFLTGKLDGGGSGAERFFAALDTHPKIEKEVVPEGERQQPPPQLSQNNHNDSSANRANTKSTSVMGRNVSVYDRSKSRNGKGMGAFKVSGLYR